MSKEAYQAERRRLRREAKDWEGIMRINRDAQIRRELYPQEDDRAISIAREMGRNSNGMNRRADGIENYFVK